MHALILALVLAASRVAAADVPYPTGYRDWAHVKAMLIHGTSHPLFGAFGGLHHVYANDAAAGVLRARQGTFPDGSVLVFDLLEAPEAGGAYTEGPRKVLAVMQKDAARWKDTGGWGWEAFAGGDPAKRTVTDARGQCFACHQPQEPADSVFSTWTP